MAYFFTWLHSVSLSISLYRESAADLESKKGFSIDGEELFYWDSTDNHFFYIFIYRFVTFSEESVFCQDYSFVYFKISSICLTSFAQYCNL